MRILGKTINLFVGLTRHDVDERAREAQEERVEQERGVRETQDEEKQKRRTGRRLVARLDVRDMTEEEFMSLFDANGGSEGSPGGTSGG